MRVVRKKSVCPDRIEIVKLCILVNFWYEIQLNFVLLPRVGENETNGVMLKSYLAAAPQRSLAAFVKIALCKTIYNSSTPQRVLQCSNTSFHL